VVFCRLQFVKLPVGWKKIKKEGKGKKLLGWEKASSLRIFCWLCVFAKMRNVLDCV